MRAIAMPALLLALLFLFGAGPAGAADLKAGAKAWRKCKACHTLKADKHKVGPSLKGVIGRKAGTAAGFKRYSKAMKRADIVWDEDAIRQYLADPKGFIPGNRMQFRALRKQADIDNVIAYIVSRQ